MKKGFGFKSIQAKILLGFGVLIIFVLALGVFNYLAVDKLNQRTEEILSEDVSLLVLDKEYEVTLEESTTLFYTYIITEDSSLIPELEATFAKGDQLEEQLRAGSFNQDLDTVFNKRQEWNTEAYKIIDLYAKEKYLEGREALLDAKTIMDDIKTEVKELAVNREFMMQDKGQKIYQFGTSTIIFVMIISTIVLIIGILIAIFTSRSISNPIKIVKARMLEIADGDLTSEPIDTNKRDEIAELIHATNVMSTNSNKLLQKIAMVSGTVAGQSNQLTQSAEEVKLGSEQIAITMEELATGSETQANSASNVAELIGEFTTRIEQANENGQEVRQHSQEVLSLTNTGSMLMQSSSEQMKKIDEIVHLAVEKMANLDQQSKQISELVEVIKRIADQTNLLALNAAIEAARAGEQGKGFAVVADEVRKLAEEVSLSVNDITGIVSTIQVESQDVADSLNASYQEVEQGTAQINQTGETFTQISTAVSSVVEHIQTLYDHLTEITTSSQQMNGAIEEIASVSEEAAAGVEETAASAQQMSSSMEEVASSSDSLAESADELNQLLNNFKL